MIGADDDAFFDDDPAMQRIAQQRLARKNGPSVAQGALSGAQTGASKGSAGGPWGTLIGGVAGAIGGAVGSQLEDRGKPDSRRSKFGEFLQGKGEYAQKAESAASLGMQGAKAVPKKRTRSEEYGLKWTETPEGGQQSELGDFEFDEGGMTA